MIRTRNLERRKPVVAWTQGYGVDGTDPTLGAIKAVLEREARRVLPLWAPLLGWTMLARGDIDAIIGYRPQLIDLPGGMLLAQESGLEIKTLRGEHFTAPLDQNTEADADLSFVSATQECLPKLLEWLGRAVRLAPHLAKVFDSS